MIFEAGLTKNFSGEAAKTACYLINSCPSSAFSFKTPQEVWIGKPASYHHLRVFGCAAFAHIKQDKLLPRAKNCIFLGYPDGVKGYKLWCIEKDSKKIIRDVTFNESEIPLAKGRVQKSVVEVQGTENKVDS